MIFVVCVTLFHCASKSLLSHNSSPYNIIYCHISYISMVPNKENVSSIRIKQLVFKGISYHVNVLD